MPRVAVVSDTTGYLPREVVERHGIHLVSLYVNHAGKQTEREIDMPDFERFYEDLRSTERLPTTSQPAVGDFLAAYEPLLEAGHDVVSVHISDGISGTGNSARRAAEALERRGTGRRVRVVDSATTAGALGLVQLAAVQAAAELDDLDAVAERIREARSELKMWFTLDTLEFLRRGGRIGPVGAWVGSTLRIKPIITIESEIRPVERVRTASRAFERLVEYARQRHASGADGWCVQHARWPAPAQKLAARCREVFGTEPAFISEVGPVLGTHAGPGMLGIAALPARFLPAAAPGLPEEDR